MNLRTPLIALAASAITAASLTGCGEDGTIGSSLLDDQVQIVVDSSFTITGKSVAVNSVRPGTMTELIGKIEIPNYGVLSSSVVAQFLPSVELDTTNYSADNVDSVKLNFRYLPGSFIGDSVVPMRVTVYPLTQQLPSMIGSDFDPAGYYNPNDKLGSVVYAPSTLDDSISASQTTRTMAVKLPNEFGKTLFNKFEANPANFASGPIFTQNVFPGIYVESTYGSGRVMKIARTTVTVHLSKITKKDTIIDTTHAEHEYLCVSPEVINNNNIKVEYAQSLIDKIEAGSTMLVAPAGYNVDVRFPAPEIISTYRNNSGKLALLNSVTMEIPADTIATNKKAVAPTYVLMVLKKDMNDFFANKQIPDNKTSFYATYSSTTGYSFSGMGSFVKDLMEKDELKEEDYTFTLVPVNITFEQNVSSYYSTSYEVSDVQPLVESPAVAELRLDKAKIKLTYSKQTNL